MQYLVQFHFAADRKQLVASFPEGLRGVISPISLQKILVSSLKTFSRNSTKEVGYGIFDRCSNLDKRRPEVAVDVIFSVAVQQVGLGVCVKFGDSRSNRSQDIRLLHFVTNDDGLQVIIT